MNPYDPRVKIVYRVEHWTAYLSDGREIEYWNVSPWQLASPSLDLDDAPGTQHELYRTTSYAEANDPDVRTVRLVMTR